MMRNPPVVKEHLFLQIEETTATDQKILSSSCLTNSSSKSENKNDQINRVQETTRLSSVALNSRGREI
jgi:hypothetical protein